eukprot:Lankesteria_metandrocarpae@DN5198_c0_g1_i1.p1
MSLSCQHQTALHNNNKRIRLHGMDGGAGRSTGRSAAPCGAGDYVEPPNYSPCTAADQYVSTTVNTTAISSSTSTNAGSASSQPLYGVNEIDTAARGRCDSDKATASISNTQCPKNSRSGSCGTLVEEVAPPHQNDDRTGGEHTGDDNSAMGRIAPLSAVGGMYRRNSLVGITQNRTTTGTRRSINSAPQEWRCHDDRGQQIHLQHNNVTGGIPTSIGVTGGIPTSIGVTGGYRSSSVTQAHGGAPVYGSNTGNSSEDGVYGQRPVRESAGSAQSTQEASSHHRHRSRSTGTPQHTCRTGDDHDDDAGNAYDYRRSRHTGDANLLDHFENTANNSYEVGTGSVLVGRGNYVDGGGGGHDDDGGGGGAVAARHHEVHMSSRTQYNGDTMHSQLYNSIEGVALSFHGTQPSDVQ